MTKSAAKNENSEKGKKAIPPVAPQRSSKKFWKKRLSALCKQISALEKKMIPDTWVDSSYDLFDACRLERSEIITRINWILDKKFNRPPEPSFHRSTQIEVALSLIE